MKTRTEGQIARGGVAGESTTQAPPSESLSEQYSLAKILGIWAAAALPMGPLAWVIEPTIIPHTSRFTPVAVPECRQAGEMTGSKGCEVQPAGSKTTLPPSSGR